MVCVRFAYLPQNFGIGAGIFAILLFILMTGASSTAIRAGIMATLVLVARATGRNYDVARALVLAGVCMILLNPFVLVFDVSFQLSFIATIAVIFFTPKIEKYFLWVPKNFKLREIFSVTSAAYIFVLPFILYKMGNLSIVAWPTNILILPFIPFTMLLGFITGVLGLISIYLSFIPAFFANILLWYQLTIVHLGATMPYGAINLPSFSPMILILTYGIIFAMFYFLKQK